MCINLVEGTNPMTECEQVGKEPHLQNFGTTLIKDKEANRNLKISSNLCVV